MAREIQSLGNREALSICERIVELYETVQRTAPDARISGRARDPWIIYTETNRVTFSDEILLGHRFYDDFSKLKSSPPGRMLMLSKEIASLTTSLPPGIFLKIADSRTDVMKVLIVGAEGSPYEGGLFIFDIFLDEKWPVEPPKVRFVLYEGLDQNESMFSVAAKNSLVCSTPPSFSCYSGSRALETYPESRLTLLLLKHQSKPILIR